jgi:signal transduction histidine kinase
MAEAELRIFLIIANIILLAFFAGVFLFVWQYRKRKLLNEKEKQGLHVKYQNEILNARVEAQEQTMLFIGQEIHDNVGQKLTLASLYAKHTGAVPGEGQREKISEIGHIIDESLSELRQLSKSLSNPHLANARLFELLNEEAKRINASGVIRVVVSGNASEQHIPHVQKNVLYRLLQEFIQNSLKHAQCQQINIDINSSENGLNITASDDGIGFVSGEQFLGIGLKNMKRRADQLQADYNISSEPGIGTTMVLSVKMNS